MSEVCLSLAQESAMIVGKFGQKFPARIPAILNLFSALIKDNNTNLVEQIILSVREMFSVNADLEHSAEFRRFFESIETMIDYVNTEKMKVALAWTLARFYNFIDPAPYLLERMISELDDKKPAEEELIYTIINSTLYLFFKRPAETLPVLSRLFGFVLNNPNSDCMVAYKCGLYY